MGDAVNEPASTPHMMVPPPPPRRKRRGLASRREWLHLLLALLILVCGIVIGAGVTLLVVHRIVTEFVHDPERLTERMAHRMERQLGLSDAQADQIQAILKRRVDALLAIRRDIRPRIAEQIELLEGEVREVLTPDQMRRWHKYLERIKEVLLGPEDEHRADDT